LVEDNAWWEVDLLGSFDIITIHVHRASDLEMEFTLLIMQIYNDGKWGIEHTLEKAHVNNVTINAKGSKIRIERRSSGHLALADVLVMGNPIGADGADFDIPIGKMLYQDVSFGFPIWDGIKNDLALNDQFVILNDWNTLTLTDSHVITDVILRISDNTDSEYLFTLSIDHDINGMTVETINLTLERAPHMVHFVLPPNLLGNTIKIHVTSHPLLSSSSIQVIGSALAADTLHVSNNTQPQLNNIGIIQNSPNSVNRTHMEGNSYFENIELIEGADASGSVDALVRFLSSFSKKICIL